MEKHFKWRQLCLSLTLWKLSHVLGLPKLAQRDNNSIYCLWKDTVVLLYSVLVKEQSSHRDEENSICFSLDWASFKRKWSISMKLQRGSKEWVTLSSLYHTRKQPRIKNLLFWDYCMNLPPSIMKGFCFPVDRSSSTILSKYIVPHLLTVTIVAPSGSGERRR